MRNSLFFLIILLTIVSCSHSGWSLREQSYIKNIPVKYQNHFNGILKEPSTEDIDLAIKFGRNDKNGSALEYAYITRANFGGMTVYCKIFTPLRLVAEHSRKCDREYINIDENTIEYLKNLNAVKIQVSPQYTSTNTWNTYAYNQDFILLCDGIRVPTVKQISALNRSNPFESIIFTEVNDIQKKAMQDVMQYTQMYTSAYTRVQKITYCKQLKMMGYSDSEIVNFTGFPQDSVRVYIGDAKSNKTDVIYFTEKDNVYSVDELNKPGNYEIVFRTPATNNLLSSGDEEKRFPISFKKFK